MNYNEIMRDLAQYQRIAKETAAIIDGLKDSLKSYMTEQGITDLKGDEHKATYKTVTSSRVDTTALKKDLPDIAEKYTKTTSSMRFMFA